MFILIYKHTYTERMTDGIQKGKQTKTCSAYKLNAPTPTWFTFTTEIITARKGYKHYSQCYCPDPEYHSDPHQWGSLMTWKRNP